MAHGDERYRGPGWSGTILVSLVVSCASVLGFHWASRNGMLPPAWQTQVSATPASVAVALEQEGSPSEVPMLSGLTLESARELLASRGLRLVVGDKRPHPALPADRVISQEPLPASMLPAQSEVRVTLSSGPAASGQVPNVSGQSIEEATRTLQAAGFKLGPIEGPTSGERSVTGSVPAAGASAAAGSEVALTVAVAGVEVPKLLNMSWQRARKLLEEAGLKPGKVRVGYNDNRDAWVVLKQTPEAGTIVQPGSTVDVVRNEGD